LNRFFAVLKQVFGVFLVAITCFDRLNMIDAINYPLQAQQQQQQSEARKRKSVIESLEQQKKLKMEEPKAARAEIEKKISVV